MLMAMDFRVVTFVERGGAGARDALRALGDRCRSTGRPARLLVGRDDESLYLLEVEGEPDPDAPELAGARTWRFRHDAEGDARPAEGLP